MTKASIIIPSRGGRSRLPVLLHALGQQTHEDWEAIVVVDGDIDGSENLLRSWDDPRVHAIVFDENRGRVAALNMGFARASGDVLIRCDDDLEPAADFVERHIAHHSDAQRPVGVIGPYDNQTPDNRYATVYGNEADAAHSRKVLHATEENWRFWAGNCSVSRATWDAVGRYDARYRAYGWEDVDYGYRLRAAGIPLIIDANLTTRHHAAATNVTARARRAFHSGAARRTFDSIHGPGASGPPSPPGDSPWNKLVTMVARHLTYSRTVKLAQASDRAIRFAPKPAAKKIIALLVEASSWAGYRETTARENDI